MASEPGTVTTPLGGGSGLFRRQPIRADESGTPLQRSLGLWQTWVRFAAWFVVSCFVYGPYGRSRSRLARGEAPADTSDLPG